MQGPPPQNPFGAPVPPEQDMFMYVNENNFFIFMMQNPYMVETTDQELFKKNSIATVKNMIFSIAIGTFLNI